MINIKKRLTDYYSDIKIVEGGKCYIVVSDKGKYGVLDKNFNIIYDCKYSTINYNEEKFVMLKNNKLYIKGDL